MSINQIRLYDLFRKELSLSDDKAADFVLAVAEVAGSEAESQKQLLATKEDAHQLEFNLGSDIRNLELKLGDNIHNLELKLGGDIHNLELKLEDDIHNLEFKLGGDIHNLELKLEDDIHNLEFKIGNDIHNLELKIEQSRADTYKAMFWTGIAQLIAILGGVLAIVKFTK
ncbi:MAG: hypothetical protein Q8918_05260 [Bacteroidota bacterium]|nr:hypothetical protein [Bacteroidota bacterium]MDP4212101.1 hypothetical protein [Bacteroidota bacterium]MDP4249505.1 hypothetical protein [Bacteroidota bacterium]